jgi:opacity protein-like surface antigen
MTTTKKHLLSLLLLCSTSAAFAQPIRLNLYGAYAFDDKFDSYYSNTSYYEGKIKGGFIWGAGLEYMVRQQQSVEFSYQRLDTKAPTTYFQNGIKSANFDLGLNYFMLGGNHYFTNNPKIQPYGGLQAGLALAELDNPANNNSDTKTAFAWGLKLGSNFFVTDRVGIKLQTSLISAVQSVGGGFYFGTGGAGAGLTSYSSMYQFQIGGGLVFKLGQPVGAAAKPATRVN